MEPWSPPCCALSLWLTKTKQLIWKFLLKPLCKSQNVSEYHSFDVPEAHLCSSSGDLEIANKPPRHSEHSQEELQDRSRTSRTGQGPPGASPGHPGGAPGPVLEGFWVVFRWFGGLIWCCSRGLGLSLIHI